MLKLTFLFRIKTVRVIASGYPDIIEKIYLLKTNHIYLRSYLSINVYIQNNIDNESSFDVSDFQN